MDIRQFAQSFVERAETLGYKGVARDRAALDYFCGAAYAAQMFGREDDYQQLGRIAALIVSVRGYLGVWELALSEAPEQKRDKALSQAEGGKK